MSAIRVFVAGVGVSVPSSINIICLAVAPQAPIDPPLPAVGPPRWAKAAQEDTKHVQI